MQIFEFIKKMKNQSGACFVRYFDYKGTSTRSEFWYFYLTWCSLSVLFGFLAEIFASFPFLSRLFIYWFNFQNTLFGFTFFAVGARRLHEIGRSGWWQLLALTGFGLIPLVYLWSKAPKPATK